MRVACAVVIDVLTCGLATAFAAAQGASVKQVAYARVDLAHAVASDAEILKAVASKNAVRETRQAIEAREREWSTTPAVRKAATAGLCADRLRAMTRQDPVVVEAILMDERGTSVCSSRETSDYWQGDEDKWRKTFVDGLDPFVDEPAFDASSGTYAIQLSVPVKQADRRVGALTLTLKVQKSALAPAR